MAMRMSGMISGMDTESIISQLVEARSTKVTKAKKDQTLVQWKSDIWKDLNKKLKNLQSKHLNNMRFSMAYAKRTTSVSDSSAVSVITGEEAVEGVQSLTVDKLAKTAYLTGDKVAKRAGDDVSSDELTALSKVRDLIPMSDADGNPAARSLTLTKKDGTQTKVEINSATTISDVLTEFKKAGVNANFDAKQQRFFISAKESGEDNNFTITADSEDTLKAFGLKIPAAGSGETGANYIPGQNAKITLNGATFENSNNVFEINGLTLTALKETNGEEVTVTTNRDTTGIYDMIKNFLKEYNEIINELDKVYNADSAKDFEPLTDDEKEAMSEAEVEKYEKKIKDSLLRRDNSVYRISNALKQTMSGGVEVNGEMMYLSNFGIETLSYFSAADNEKSAYHIDGDPDDADTSGKADKLKGMIANDPDTAIAFFSSLSQKLYKAMDEQSKAVEGYRSFGSFYDDKKMASDYTDYKDKITLLEKKLADYEDGWYKKFAKMETALAKMQDGANAVTGLLGGS